MGNKSDSESEKRPKSLQKSGKRRPGKKGKKETMLPVGLKFTKAKLQTLQTRGKRNITKIRSEPASKWGKKGSCPSAPGGKETKKPGKGKRESKKTIAIETNEYWGGCARCGDQNREERKKKKKELERRKRHQNYPFIRCKVDLGGKRPVPLKSPSFGLVIGL